MEHALAYLRETFEAPVPDPAVAELAATPRPLVERLAFRSGMGHPNPLRVLPTLWERHRRLSILAREDDASVSFVEFLQQRWGLDRLSQLPAAALRRLGPAQWRRRA